MADGVKRPDAVRLTIAGRSARRGTSAGADDAEREYESTVVIVPKTKSAQDAGGDQGNERSIVLPRRKGLRLERDERETYEQTVVTAGRFRATPEASVPPENAPSLMKVPEALRAQFSGEAEGQTARESYAASKNETNYYWTAVRPERRSERYSLQNVRDKGGMGVILEVLDLDLKRKAVMKVLLPRWRCRSDILDSFVREARVTGFLEHPHIIPIHELGLTREAGLFFTMKLAEGESLRAVIAKLKRADADYVAKYTTYALLGVFRKVCDAVAHAHANRILHLDIKPHNILIGRHGEVFLTDWGLARVMGDPARETDPVRREFLSDVCKSMEDNARHVGGTPAYMSPEHAACDWAALDSRTDVFLLGATLYHMLTLTPPYFGASTPEVIDMARAWELEVPATRSPERQIPEELCRIVMKAMARDKQDRYAAVEDLARDIDEVMAGRWRPESRKEFEAGELLMKQGDPAREGYVILIGRVGVFSESDGKRVSLRECGPGEIVGEMALISNEPRSASVEALEDTSTAVITGERLAEHLKNLPPYIGKMVSILADRLRESSEMVHPLLTGDCTKAVIRQIRLLESAASEPASREEVERQVAGDLGLPIQRVREAVARALDEGLLSLDGAAIRVARRG